MALTTEATTNLPAQKEPTSWADPATTITFSGTPVEEAFSTTIAAAGVTHADMAGTGLTALVAAVKSWVDGTWVPNTLKLDVTGSTINGIITITNIVRNNGQSTTPNQLYLTGTDQFTVTGTFKYE